MGSKPERIIAAVAGIVAIVTFLFLLSDRGIIPSGSDGIKRIAVSASNLNGTPFTFDKAGTYEIAYEGGTYSTGLEQGGKQFRTAVHIYKAIDGIRWGDRVGFFEPLNALFILGCRADNQPANEQTEIDCAKKTNFTAHFEKGESLIFVAVDERESYGDNRGSVTVRISEISSP
jgi:hypothetical protein